MMCSRCKKRVAVVFIASMNGDQTPGEGLCLVCAKELGIKPVDDMMSRMGIAEEDLESLSDQMTDLMSMDSDNIQELTQSLNELDEMSDGENQDGFEPGGAATLSFFQKIFGGPDKAKENAAQENGMAGQKAKYSKQVKADKDDKYNIYKVTTKVAGQETCIVEKVDTAVFLKDENLVTKTRNAKDDAWVYTVKADAYANDVFYYLVNTSGSLVKSKSGAKDGDSYKFEVDKNYKIKTVTLED